MTRDRTYTDKLNLALASAHAAVTVARRMDEPKLVDAAMQTALDGINEAEAICAEIRTELAKL